MAWRGLWLVPLVLVVAGCLQPDGLPDEDAVTDAIPVDWSSRALQNGEEHDHYDRSHHANLTTPNFEVVGWDPLVTDHHGSNAGGYFCGDVKQVDGRSLAVVESYTSDVAFVLIDVTDPARPTKVGELLMEQTHVWDIAVTPDQQFVILATSPFGNVDEEGHPLDPDALAPAPKMWFRDACTGETRPVAGPEAGLPYHSGAVLVDISDPSAPAVADFFPLPVLGGHSVVASEIGGETLVLLTVSNTIYTNYYLFMGILDTPAGGRFEPHSTYQSDRESLGQTGPFLFNHDGVLQEHPLTGEALAFIADGDWGVTILNIDDPKMPRVLSRWNEAAAISSPDDWHFAHSILPIEGTWDGRHYTFVSEECAARPEEAPSCLAYVLDTTDPAQPTLVSAWTLPHDVGAWSYPEFSPHYMALIDRTLFLAHWHAGVWAIDVSNEEALQNLSTIGVFVPDRDVPFVPGGSLFGPYNMSPIVADVVAVDQHLIVFDGTSGVYVVTFDPTRPAPAPDPWPLNVP